MYLVPSSGIVRRGRNSPRIGVIRPAVTVPSLGYLRSGRLGDLGSVPANAPAIASMAPNVAAAMEKVFPQSSIRNHVAYALSAYNWTLASVKQGYLNDYEPGVLGGTVVSFTGGTSGCGTKVSALKSQILSTAGGGALSVGSKVVAIPGAQIPGAIILGVGAVLTAIGKIFGHHSAAVAKERGTLCAAVPMANAALQQIDQWLAAGQITAATASQALQAVQSNFRSEVAGIYQTRNEAGGYYRALQGIIIRRTLDLQQAAAGGAGIAEQISLSTGLPPAVLYGGIALLAYYLFF